VACGECFGAVAVADSFLLAVVAGNQWSHPGGDSTGALEKHNSRFQKTADFLWQGVYIHYGILDSFYQEAFMEYRPFGRTGLQVSAIGFGCWELGGQYGHYDESEVIDAVQRALDLGVNCFDTAEGYGFGRSEALLARALGSRRKDVIVVTKFGIYQRDEKWYRDSTRGQALAAIERSLKFLNTDYVDVYLIHWPDRQTPFEEPMAALEEIVQAGKARFVGVSNFKAEEVATCMATRRVDVGQYGYHLFDRRMEREVFPYYREQGIGMMAYGSLAHGLLTGAFTPQTTFAENDWRRGGRAFGLSLFTPENFQKNLAVVEDLKAIAAQRGKTVLDLALRWVLANPVVSTALVGFRKPAEVDGLLGALDWSLTAEEMAAIDAAFRRHDVDPAPPVWLE
jgi:aryl-alcohol dehydrogenase-like predicted oxidoreductase